MKKLVITFCALLVGPAISNAQALAGATGERAGITAVARHVFDDITMPGKEFRVLHTTYAPGKTRSTTTLPMWCSMCSKDRAFGRRRERNPSR